MTDKHPTITGLRCPACNSMTLFLAEGNYITCGWIECPNPDYQEALKQLNERACVEARNLGYREGEAREAVYQLTWCRDRQPTGDEYNSLIMHYSEIVEEIEATAEHLRKKP